MLVYRVEYPKDGLGPYRGSLRHNGVEYTKDELQDLSSLSSVLCTKHDSSNGHPAIGIDFCTVSFSKAFFCCFTDIRSLKDWFRGYRASLRRIGFRVGVYEISNTFVQYGDSQRQAIFVRDEAKLIKTVSIP